MLVDKNILLISPEPWASVFLSKHHYAVNLAIKGNKVYFLNPPTEDCRISKTRYTNLAVVDYKGFLPGLRFLPKFFRKILLKRVFEKIQKECNCRFDIIWSFDNSVFYDFEALPERVIKISHIVDMDQNFQFIKAAQSADFCICIAHNLLDKFKPHNPNSHFIHHGYDSQFDTKPYKIESEGKIRIGYAGSLDMIYIDWEVIELAVEKYNDFEFYFAGPSKKKFVLAKYSNAHHVGRLEKSELMGFYEEMDLLISAYRDDLFKEQLTNSHKVMEYLGSGKPIISSYLEEYKDVDDFIEMARDRKSWIDKFTNVVTNLSYWKSEDKSVSRITYARNNAYHKQIDRIEEIIYNE